MAAGEFAAALALAAAFCSAEMNASGWASMAARTMSGCFTTSSLSLVGEGEQEAMTAAARRSGMREYRMRRAPGTGELIRDREAQGSYQPRGTSASGEARPPR